MYQCFRMLTDDLQLERFDLITLRTSRRLLPCEEFDNLVDRIGREPERRDVQLWVVEGGRFRNRLSCALARKRLQAKSVVQDVGDERRKFFELGKEILPQ